MAVTKLLVVEDDPAGLELMTEIFNGLDAQVCPLSDSREAARLVEQERYDCVVLDLKMPGLDGFELAQMIRRSMANKATPIVIVTGRDELDTLHLSFSAGATFFLQKPIDKKKLTNLLRTVREPLYENRRRCNRVPLQTEVICTVGDRTLAGVTWNISQGGIQLEVAGLQRYDIARLSFRLPNFAPMINAQGTVMWAGDDRQGIYFTEMSLEDQERVRAYVMQVELSPK